MKLSHKLLIIGHAALVAYTLAGVFVLRYVIGRLVFY
jgi:hypothetical protein